MENRYKSATEISKKYEWATVSSSVRFSPPEIENAFDENLNLSDSFKKLCEHQKWVTLLHRTLNRRNPLFDDYANKMNLYGGEV